ncbi:YodC family protein [Aeromonas veronii]|uniref:YodC family protein n=1 Tax=Aeromonas TaxID=642 RepID=UPI0009B834E5|nr:MULTISPECIES: DUF2158 domain-containing protein [Aeromonas]MCF5759185.1 YodC family protein [Aeromonas veronii]MCF5849865.1 YodC family protein [Aeromonas veronii]QWZ85340.1 YodC family protein [Aeromonas sp. FDAARGOS 1404]HDN9000639.1 DUF2158 domain-containing protein [Aeromonas veronii AMC24]
MTYSIGDVVYLNSGGPYMTVTYVDALDNELRCKWFFNGQENQGIYPSAAVSLRPEPKNEPANEAGSVKLWD